MSEAKQQEAKQALADVAKTAIDYMVEVNCLSISLPCRQYKITIERVKSPIYYTPSTLAKE